MRISTQNNEEPSCYGLLTIIAPHLFLFFYLGYQKTPLFNIWPVNFGNFVVGTILVIVFGGFLMTLPDNGKFCYFLILNR